MSVCKPGNKIVIFVTNSLGELDFLAPILFREHRNLAGIEIVFFNQKIYERFLSSLLYVSLFEKLKVRIIFFEADCKSFKSVFSLRVMAFMCKRILKSDSIFVEQTAGSKLGRIILSIAYILSKTIIIHPHAANIEIGARTKKRSSFATINPILLSNLALKEVYKKQGFQQFVYVGFPKFYQEWIDLAANFYASSKNDGYALVFSRPLNDIWMPKDTYDRLVSETIDSIRLVFGNIPIIFKIHPREDKVYLLELFNRIQCQIVSISEENSMALTSKARFVVGFFTSGVYDAYAYKKPSVDFYYENQLMRSFYPNGRSNKILGLDFADTKIDLMKFLKSVKSDEYQCPYYIEELHSSSNRSV